MTTTVRASTKSQSQEYDELFICVTYVPQIQTIAAIGKICFLVLQCDILKPVGQTTDIPASAATPI